MTDTIDERLHKALSIIAEVDFPSLPSHIQTIREELMTTEPSMARIAGLVAQDMALSGRVLKMVNSAAFGLRSRISDLKQAVTILGLTTFYTAVIAAAVRNSFAKNDLSEKGFTRFWDHAQATALKTRTAAVTLAKIRPDLPAIDLNDAYLAGLFHDGGIPVMATRYRNYEKQVVAAFDTGEFLCAAEDRLFGTDHSIVSYLIAKKWELPPQVYEAIINHHDLRITPSRHTPAHTIAILLCAAEASDDLNGDHPFTAAPCTREAAELLLSREFDLNSEETTLFREGLEE